MVCVRAGHHEGDRRKELGRVLTHDVRCDTWTTTKVITVRIGQIPVHECRARRKLIIVKVIVTRLRTDSSVIAMKVIATHNASITDRSTPRR